MATAEQKLVQKKRELELLRIALYGLAETKATTGTSPDLAEDVFTKGDADDLIRAYNTQNTKRSEEIQTALRVSQQASLVLDDIDEIADEASFEQPSSRTITQLLAVLGVSAVHREALKTAQVDIPDNNTIAYSLKAAPDLSPATIATLDSLGLVLVSDATAIAALNKAINDGKMTAAIRQTASTALQNEMGTSAAAKTSGAKEAKLRAENEFLRTKVAWLENTPPATLESTIARTAMPDLAKKVPVNDWNNLLAFLKRGAGSGDLAPLYKNGVSSLHMQLTSADMTALAKAAARGFNGLKPGEKKGVQRCAEAANAMLRLATNPAGTGPGRGYGLELDDKGKSKSCWEAMKHGGRQTKAHFHQNRGRYIIGVCAAFAIWITAFGERAKEPQQPCPQAQAEGQTPSVAPQVTPQQKAWSTERNLFGAITSFSGSIKEIDELTSKVKTANARAYIASASRNDSVFSSAIADLEEARADLKDKREGLAFDAIPKLLKIATEYKEAHHDLPNSSKHSISVFEAKGGAFNDALSAYHTAMRGSDSCAQVDVTNNLTKSINDLIEALGDLATDAAKDLTPMPQAPPPALTAEHQFASVTIGGSTFTSTKLFSGARTPLYTAASPAQVNVAVTATHDDPIVPVELSDPG